MKKNQNTNSRRVFISYAAENMAYARRLYNDLQRAGVDVIVDFIDFEPGKSVPEQINEALNWCDTLILLWSEQAVKSRYVIAEWQAAFHLHRRIIPCLLDGTMLPPLLSYCLYIVFDDYHTGYPKLCKAMGVTSKAENIPAST